MKIYEYSTSRNKFKEKGKNAITTKKKLIKIKGNVCYICKKEFNKLCYLELEHKIPIQVGGHLFNNNNVELVCKRCHVNKTRVDIKTINMMKKSRIISGKYYIHSYFTINEVTNLFLTFRKLILKIDENDKIYYFGTNGVDYIQVKQKQNRESIMED